MASDLSINRKTRTTDDAVASSSKASPRAVSQTHLLVRHLSEIPEIPTSASSRSLRSRTEGNVYSSHLFSSKSSHKLPGMKAPVPDKIFLKDSRMTWRELKLQNTPLAALLEQIPTDAGQTVDFEQIFTLLSKIHGVSSHLLPALKQELFSYLAYDFKSLRDSTTRKKILRACPDHDETFIRIDKRLKNTNRITLLLEKVKVAIEKKHAKMQATCKNHSILETALSQLDLANKSNGEICSLGIRLLKRSKVESYFKEIWHVDPHVDVISNLLDKIYQPIQCEESRKEAEHAQHSFLNLEEDILKTERNIAIDEFNVMHNFFKQQRACVKDIVRSTAPILHALPAKFKEDLVLLLDYYFIEHHLKNFLIQAGAASLKAQELAHLTKLDLTYENVEKSVGESLALLQKQNSENAKGEFEKFCNGKVAILSATRYLVPPLVKGEDFPDINLISWLEKVIKVISKKICGKDNPFFYADLTNIVMVVQEAMKVFAISQAYPHTKTDPDLVSIGSMIMKMLMPQNTNPNQASSSTPPPSMDPQQTVNIFIKATEKLAQEKAQNRKIKNKAEKNAAAKKARDAHAENFTLLTNILASGTPLPDEFFDLIYLIVINRSENRTSLERLTNEIQEDFIQNGSMPQDPIELNRLAMKRLIGTMLLFYASLLAKGPVLAIRTVEECSKKLFTTAKKDFDLLDGLHHTPREIQEENDVFLMEGEMTFVQLLRRSFIKFVFVRETPLTPNGLGFLAEVAMKVSTKNITPTNITFQPDEVQKSINIILKVPCGDEWRRDQHFLNSVEELDLVLQCAGFNPMQVMFMGHTKSFVSSSEEDGENYDSPKL